MGILRKAILAGGLFAVLPLPPQDGAQYPASQEPAPGTFAYVAAASETYSDMTAFCQRRPLACDVGHYIATTAQAKAKYSAKIIYEWASADSRKEPSAMDEPAETAVASNIPLPLEKPEHLMARKPRPEKKS